MITFHRAQTVDQLITVNQSESIIYRFQLIDLIWLTKCLPSLVASFDPKWNSERNERIKVSKVKATVNKLNGPS